MEGCDEAIEEVGGTLVPTGMVGGGVKVIRGVLEKLGYGEAKGGLVLATDFPQVIACQVYATLKRPN